MNWTITLSRKVEKQLGTLPKGVLETFKFLMKEMQVLGPIRGSWPNYGLLAGERHHCHIKKGRPTYVVVLGNRQQEGRTRRGDLC
jgi:hypothetical protein